MMMLVNLLISFCHLTVCFALFVAKPSYFKEYILYTYKYLYYPVANCTITA